MQLITWNHYVESTAMAPSVVHGWRILDMNAYDNRLFKYGRPPRIVRDALFVSYRDQPVDARPVYPETSLMHLVPTSNNIDVVAFATAPWLPRLRAATRRAAVTPAGELSRSPHQAAAR